MTRGPCLFVQQHSNLLQFAADVFIPSMALIVFHLELALEFFRLSPAFGSLHHEDQFTGFGLFWHINWIS